MAGNLSDRISRVTDSDTGRPVVSSLASSKALGATSITLSDTTNWTTTTKIYFTIYNTLLAGGLMIKDATSQTEWQGTLSGTTISNVTLTGGTDRTYNAGAIVELTFTGKQAKDLYDNISTHANQDGTLKVNAVNATTILADGVVTDTKIATVSATKFTNPYKFSVYANNIQNSTGITKIQLNTEIFDTNNNFDAVTNYRYTAPINGYYWISGDVWVTGTNQGVSAIQKNGVTVARGSLRDVSTSTTLSSNVSQLIQLNVGDYIELAFDSGTSYATVAGAINTYMTGFLVSTT